MPKRKDLAKVDKIKISLAASEVLGHLKDTEYWGALKEFMMEYVQFQKDRAWHLSELDEKFVVRHAQLSSSASAFNDLIKYVEKEARRGSQESK